MLRHLIFLAPRSNQVAPSPSDADEDEVSYVDSIEWAVEDLTGNDHFKHGCYTPQKNGSFWIINVTTFFTTSNITS